MNFRVYYLLFLFFFFLLTIRGFAQGEGNYNVKGIVMSEEGEFLPGVVVRVGEMKQLFVTDGNGFFSLTLTESPVVLHFSYVGMAKKSVTVYRDSKELKVVLRSSSELAEVVIEGGYGLAQKRSDLVGSAFQIKAKELENLPQARVDKLLDGLAPGLTVAPNSDSPGSPRTRYNIRIRGDASLAASNEPLWIIDGVPVYQGSATNIMPGTSYTISPLSYINPLDIESITILKDASATSIYGADGANGVILVKTKSAIHDTNVQVGAFLRYGIAAIDQSTRYKVMNAAQYLSYAAEAWANGGQDINAFPFRDNEQNQYSSTNVDWGNLYFGKGQSFQAGASLRGGSPKAKNLLSLSYYEEEGTVKGNKQQRFSARLKTNYQLMNKLSVSTTLSTSYNHNKLFSLSHEYYETLPIYEPYNLDGHTHRLYNRIVDNVRYDATGEPIYEWADKKFFDNSIPDRDDNTNIQRSFFTGGVVEANYSILDGLNLTDQFGINVLTANEEMYSARTTLDGYVNNEPKGYSRRASMTEVNWNNVLRLNYNRSFGEFRIGALAAMEMKHEQVNSLYATGYGFLNDRIQEIGFAESDSRNGSSSVKRDRSLSYFGQASLSYADRYFFIANVRADGNSGFGNYSKWGNFSSLGASWILNKERFFPFDNKFIDLFKLKASFGTNGNSRIDSSASEGTYIYSDSYSYNGTIGAVSSTIANPGLSWETTTMFNTGALISFAKRVDLDVEFYINHTKDILTRIYTSRAISEDRLYANIGEMRNKGIEFTINSKNIATALFGWNTTLLFAHNKNTITKLYNGVMTSFGSTVWSEDHPKGAFYLVRWAGVDPATGAPMWYDKNDNITFAYSSDDRVILDESPHPWATGSLTNSFFYKRFSLRFMLNYQLGGHTLSALAGRGLSDGYNATSSNVDVNALPHWSAPGQLATNPRISTISSRSVMPSTRYLYETTNIRFHNFTFSYHLPESLCKKMTVQSCSLSLTGDNLYLWTRDQQRNRNSYKTLKNAYPIERNFTLSLQLTL